MYKANPNRYENMTYNRSGNSGLKLSSIALGLWHNFGDKDSFDTAKDMIFNAFDNGITYFDLANNYGQPAGSAERNFGKILTENLNSYRDEMVIATKAGYGMWEGPYGDGGSRKYLLSSLDQSLKRLNLDYVDIFYHHRMDKDTPLEESMLALDTAVKQGKALYAGVSNYDAKTTLKAVEILKSLNCPFIVNQVSYSMINRHIETDNLLDICDKSGVGLAIFSPLSQGLLSNRYFNGISSDSRIMTDGRFLKQNQVTENLIENLKKLEVIAKGRNQSLSQMALAWVLSKKGVSTVIVGSSKTSQLLENIEATKNISFSNEELNSIDLILSQIK